MSASSPVHDSDGFDAAWDGNDARPSRESGREEPELPDGRHLEDLDCPLERQVDPGPAGLGRPRDGQGRGRHEGLQADRATRTRSSGPTIPPGARRRLEGAKATEQIAYHYAKLNHLLWEPQLAQKIFEYRWDQNPPRAARALALTSIASFDTLVACWGTRYVYWYPRPFQIDPSIALTFTTPNQPAYPSGHSCIEGATSRVLEYLFPRDAPAIRSRAEELAMSRWWARIHWHLGQRAGLRSAAPSATT